MDYIELLAPAGSKESLVAGVQSGADAVYMGGRIFSARQSADNFSDEDMKTYVEYCHLYGVKVHVAVNTLVKENELKELIKYIKVLNDVGVDAIIVQDMGAVSLFRKIAPELELHASTQMTVTCLDGVRFLEDIGFRRVVLSRELSKAEIEYICKKSKAEIEVFCHGALCVCYSGQCLMSSIIGGRSGNRGCCAQPCRLPYEMIENDKSIKKGHLISPKDLSLIDELGTLKNIGVASLKIEGRLKRPEYVSAVVGVYRKYLDNVKKPSEEDKTELLNAFNRSGLTSSYFSGETGSAMMSFENPSNVSENIFTADAKKRAREDANIRKIPINIFASLHIDDVLEVTVTDNDGNCETAIGEVKSEKALNKPLESERLTAQLSKLGSTPFTLQDIYVDIDDDIVIPVSEVNKVRRRAIEMITNARVAAVRRRTNEYIDTRDSREYNGEMMLTAEVMNIEQAKVALNHGIKRLYVPEDIVDSVLIISKDVEIVTKLSDIEKDNTKNRDIKTGAVLVENFAQIKKYSSSKKYGDFRLNVFNSYSADFYSDLETITISPELNLKEIKELSKNTNANLEIIGYGRIPLMIMQNCPVKSIEKCQKNEMVYSLKDRRSEQFPIVCGDNCVAKLLNSKPIFMADKFHDIQKLKINSIRLIFTVENSQECDTIISMYNYALEGKNIKNPFRENTFTRGHYYRGVQ